VIDLLITNAGELITCRTDTGGAIGAALENLDIIAGGAVAIDGDRIVEVGQTSDLVNRHSARQVLDAGGMLVSPGLVDPHSHLLYGGSRHHEYETLITGKVDPEKRLEGGIRYTVSMTRQATAEALHKDALANLDVMLSHGTTTLEAKTGYGLDRDTELRMMQVMQNLQHPIELVPTYLGAHVVPEEYQDNRGAYVDLVVDMMREAQPYVEYVDIACDPIGFTVEECERMGAEAAALGFRLRVHADQTGLSEGSELAARLGASSADHLDYISDAGIRAMAESGTVGVLLPGVTFHMMEMVPKLEAGHLTPAAKPHWPELVRRMIEGGMRLALSADYNPGSSPTQSMQMVMQLAARLYRLSYTEIWHMSTINAAHALDRGEDRGSLEVGKRADILIWRLPEYGMIINRFGVNQVDTVVKDGQVVVEKGIPSYS
jgi:imidazolonepropionase